MDLEAEKIKKRFSEINEALAEVKRLALLDDKEFWSKKEYIAAVKYCLLQAIESVGSVYVHIAAKNLIREFRYSVNVLRCLRKKIFWKAIWH